MQKGNAKAGKISIFSPLDAKLESLAGRVGLTRFLVESGRVKSGWKYAQPDPTVSLRMFDRELCRMFNRESCKVYDKVIFDAR